MTPWIPGGAIPPCLCGALPVTRCGAAAADIPAPSSASPASPPGPPARAGGPRVYVTEAAWRLLRQRMRARAQLRQPAISTDHGHGGPDNGPSHGSRYDGRLP